MTPESDGYFSNLTDAIGRGWNKFWFTPADPLPCAVLRIGVGLLTIAHLLCLSGDLDRWYGKNALLTPAAVEQLEQLSGEETRYRFGALGRYAAPEINYHLWAAIAVAAAFTAGLLTPVSGALSLAALLSFVHRVPQVAGHVEPVLAFLLFYLILAPSWARLSLDRLIFVRKKRPVPAVSPLVGIAANVGLKLIQVHLAMFVVMMGLTKLYGDAWWDGSAIWYSLAQTQSRPLDLSGIRNAGKYGEYLINFWTLAIVYYELAFGVLIWPRVMRPLVLSLGVVVWVSLILATGQLLFALTMLIASAAFLATPVESGVKPRLAA
jgi:hypothetical protein